MADILSEEQEGSSKPKLMFGTEVLASKVLQEDLLIKAKKICRSGQKLLV